jgi:hypothetical protein
MFKALLEKAAHTSGLITSTAQAMPPSDRIVLLAT